MTQAGIKIALEHVGNYGDDEIVPGDEVVVAVSLEHLGDGRLEHVGSMQFDFRASDGVEVVDWRWRMGRRRRRTYRFGGSVGKGVVRANSMLYEPPFQYTINLRPVAKIIGWATLLVTREGSFSVVGPEINEANPYNRDRNFYLQTGFEESMLVWDKNPNRPVVIEHEPLLIEIG